MDHYSSDFLQYDKFFILLIGCKVHKNSMLRFSNVNVNN